MNENLLRDFCRSLGRSIAACRPLTLSTTGLECITNKQYKQLWSIDFNPCVVFRYRGSRRQSSEGQSLNSLLKVEYENFSIHNSAASTSF